MKTEGLTRKNLIQSLLTGLVLGTVLIGAPLGWFAHRFYSEQQLANTLICRQKNQHKSVAEVNAICGTFFY